MKLYGMAKSRSFRALWALEESGLDFEYIGVEFGGTGDLGAQGEFYKGINPQGKVPTLVDEDLILTESGAILNYIAAKVPDKQLMPKDGTRERALYDQMNYFVLSDLEQALWTTGKHRFALPEEYRFEVVFKTTAYEFEKAQNALLVAIGDGAGGLKTEFVLGDSFTMADIFLAHTIAWAKGFKFEVKPELLAYMDKMYSRPAVARALEKI